MTDNQPTKVGLPLPRWCFVLLAVPTFYMPLAYLLLAIRMIYWSLSGMNSPIMPQWLAFIAESAVIVTLVLWPIYLAWIVFSRCLAWREKGLWGFIVFLLNMAAMPIFFVFMTRRYLGIEGRTTERDERSLQRYLARHKIDRENLSAGQLNALRNYCRWRRWNRWMMIANIPIMCLLSYSAYVLFSQKMVPIFSEMMPARFVLVEGDTGIAREVASSLELREQYVQAVMLCSANFGGLELVCLLALFYPLATFRPGMHERTLIKVLKAVEPDQSPTMSS